MGQWLLGYQEARKHRIKSRARLHDEPLFEKQIHSGRTVPPRRLVSSIIVREIIRKRPGKFVGKRQNFLHNPKPAPLEKIVSGGQTGVDRAALDVALERGIPCGGWCPRGRLAEDGRIPDRYPLTETPTNQYRQRTEWNVWDSDGTLILATGKLIGGTKLTEQFTERFGKPCFRVDFASPPDVASLKDQLVEAKIRVLNVAGPRESTEPGVYAKTAELLRHLFDAW